MNDKITSKLGLRPMPEVVETEDEKSISMIENVSATILENDNKTEIQKEHIADIEYAHENIKNLIKVSTTAFTSLSELAKSSESPGAFTVLATTLESLINANKDFISVSEKKKFAKEEVPANNEKSQTNVVNNNLIISTAEMLKMFKGE
jgi:hypothetical protein